MKTAHFDYPLPERLIARYPTQKREYSNLMSLCRDAGSIEHHIFHELPQLLRSGDILVMNNTRVIPARLIGKREGGTSRIEMLLIRELDPEKKQWLVMAKPGKRLKQGQRIIFSEGELVAKVCDVTESGERIVEFESEIELKKIIAKIGFAPLPPYIIKSRKKDGETDDDLLENRSFDRQRYQTVYAEHDGSVAAPTSGLHFTAEMIERIKEKGTQIEFITLHVGPGTFAPVRTEAVEDHRMHCEEFEITQPACDAINERKSLGGRIIAVGTTAVRALESASDEEGKLHAQKSSTDLMIIPGYTFKIVEAMITNFHLPRSTLLMLISAFAGKDFISEAYRTAIEKNYRFYSYGDAMLIQ